MPFSRTLQIGAARMFPLFEVLDIDEELLDVWRVPLQARILLGTYEVDLVFSGGPRERPALDEDGML